jgi:phytoene dehydrogenase-like protein
MSAPTTDAIVVGAGHNGLVAAILLARAGWGVTVLERSDAAGGAVRTEEVTLPGFRHDVYAGNLNLFMGSQFLDEAGDDVFRHGFEVVRAEHPFGSAFPDGRFVGVSTDHDETLASIGACSASDARSWIAAREWFERIAPQLFPLLGVPLPSAAGVRAFASGRRALGKRWPLELAQLLTQSTREFTESRFESAEVQALVSSWGMHLDFPPDLPGGALFAFLETFASAGNGMTLGRGGAGALIEALCSLLRSLGGEIVTGADVTRITLAGGRATGVEIEGGERRLASRAVIANLTPAALYGRLVGLDQLPLEFRRQIERYRYGPGTMMVHLALDDLPPWSAGESARRSSYVHLAPYLDDMSLAYQRAMANLLPEQPTLVIGQPTAVDPTRAPAGKHVLWVQVRVLPARIGGDAAGEIDATHWDDAKEPYANRVVGLVERYAPGLRELVLARHVLSPLDLERANPNLVGGDQLGGSMHPSQHYFLRPAPGWSRYRTPIEGLYVCGASTWPGAGVGAGSGYLLGKQLTRRRRPRLPGALRR